MAIATSELIWVKSFLAAMGVFYTTMKLLCDNQAAVHITKNPVFHKKTKHIEMDCNFVREQLLLGDLIT